MNRNCKDFFILTILAETPRSGHSNIGKNFLVLIEPYDEEARSFVWYLVPGNPLAIIGSPKNVRLYR